MDASSPFSNISPHVRVAMDITLEKLEIKRRIIFDYLLLYVQRGDIYVNIEGREHHAVPDDIVFFRPGEHHRIAGESAEGVSFPHVHFDLVHHDDCLGVPVNFKPAGECTPEEIGMIRRDPVGGALMFPDIIKIENAREVLKLLYELVHVKKHTRDVLMEKIIMLEILRRIIDGLRENQNGPPPAYEADLFKAADYIKNNLSEEIRFDSLAKIACISPSYFRKLFKIKFGVSPKQYQIKQRMESAKEYLAYSHLSIGEIAGRTGYDSIHAFSKAFKLVEHFSPSEYRNLHFGNWSK